MMSIDFHTYDSNENMPYADVFEDSIKIGTILRSGDNFSFITHISNMLHVKFSSNNFDELKGKILKYYSEG